MNLWMIKEIFNKGIGLIYNDKEKVTVMQNFGMSMLWFWVCYIIVTLVGMLHTIFNIYVLHMKPMDKESMGEGYE